MENKTDFGYQEVSPEEKTRLVGKVFTSVAAKYDVMNDLMSGGIHRLWKRYAIDSSGVRPGDKVLDLAGGTGDLSRAFVKRVQPEGFVILADINASMLKHGRDRLINAGITEHCHYTQVNAEQIPFTDNYFDCLSIAFGLRNVTDKLTALKSMYRVLKPGGKLLVLEFSKPIIPGLSKLYDGYSFKILPWLGKIVANDAESYRYLAESIRKHPDQDSLKEMILNAGFDECTYHNLSGGIVALHIGFKY